MPRLYGPSNSTQQDDIPLYFKIIHNQIAND